RLRAVTGSSLGGPVGLSLQVQQPIAYGRAHVVHRRGSQHRPFSLAWAHPYHADAEPMLTRELDPCPQHQDLQSLADHLLTMASRRHGAVTVTPAGMVVSGLSAVATQPASDKLTFAVPITTTARRRTGGCDGSATNS